MINRWIFNLFFFLILLTIIGLQLMVSSLVAGLTSIVLLILVFIFFNIFLNAKTKFAENEMQVFNHSVSHELRAQLHAILAFTEIILEDHGENLKPEAKDALNRVVGASHKMKQVIDGVLDLLKYARTELVKEQVNLSLIAQAIANELQRLNPDRKVHFAIRENLRVKGDSRLLTVVMTNLIQNAYKFTSKQTDAHIEFGMLEKKDGVDTYFLKDNGAGFDMRHLNKLFHAFQRLHASYEFPGIGLGLANVQQIINRHDGRIWAEAELQKGATFFFTLKRGTLCIKI